MHRNTENFIALLKPVYSNAVTYCLALARNEADAKDLFQESMLKSLQYFHALKDESRFKSWLFTIITREYYSMYRKSLSRTLFYKKIPVETTTLPLVFPAELKDSRMQILLNALDGLEKNARAALVLFEIGEFSIEEIMIIQGERSLSTVKSRISRAREKINSTIKNEKSKNKY